jgi:hypothetical protein
MRWGQWGLWLLGAWARLCWALAGRALLESGRTERRCQPCFDENTRWWSPFLTTRRVGGKRRGMQEAGPTSWTKYMHTTFSTLVRGCRGASRAGAVAPSLGSRRTAPARQRGRLRFECLPAAGPPAGRLCRWQIGPELFCARE